MTIAIGGDRGEAISRQGQKRLGVLGAAETREKGDCARDLPLNHKRRLQGDIGWVERLGTLWLGLEGCLGLPTSAEEVAFLLGQP